MPEISPNELTVAAILYLIIRDLLTILKATLSKKNGSADAEAILKPLAEIVSQWRSVAKNVESTSRKTDALFDWHNVQDSDGVKIWYNKQSTVEDIKVIKDAYVYQSKLIDGMIDKLVKIETRLTTEKR